MVPTYKESENCTNLVLAQPGNFYILVVEGNSTDGTGEFAEGLAARVSERMSVLHGEGKKAPGGVLAGAHVLARRTRMGLNVRLQ